MNILKIKLIEKLSNICDEIMGEQAIYEKVERFTAKIMDAPEDMPDVENEISKIVVHRSYSYLVKLNLAILQQGLNAGKYYKIFQDECTDKGINIENISLQVQKQISQKAAICGNIISSLRMIDDIDVTDFIKEVSYTENILLKDPLKIYDNMTADSKRCYRACIQNIAKSIGRSEFAVSAMALRIAKDQNKHIGLYILNDTGKEELYSNFNSKYTSNKNTGIVFYGFTYISALILSLLFALFLIVVGGKPAATLILPIVSFPLFYKASLFFIKWVANKILPDRPLAVLDIKTIEDSSKAIVIVPVLAISKPQIEEAISTLELAMLTNNYQNLNFGLVVDYKASAEQFTTNDHELTIYINNRINILNQTYGKKFYFFSRKKQYNPKTGNYSPLERKRGAIIEFNKLMINGVNSSFENESMDEDLKNTKYAITFDEDTRITHGEILKMIGAMQHPLNVPEIIDGKLISGFCIMQPNVRIKLPDANRSSFTKAFSGSQGYDHYTNNSSRLSMKLFGHGMYFGKGIYSLKEFNYLLSDAFPNNIILSHDMIEGSIAGCGDINATIYESFPSTIDTYFKRYERWLRGDFQLAPWLFNLTKDINDKTINNPVPGWGRFQILNNMISYLASPSVCIGIIMAMLLGAIMQYVLFIMLPIVAVALTGTIVNMFKFRRIRENSIIGFERGMLMLALMPIKAMVTIRGIVLALYRMAVKSSNLMQWNTAASFGNAKHSLTKFTDVMYSVFIIPLIAIVSIFIWPQNTLYLILIALLFILLTFAAYESDKAERHETPAPTIEQIEFFSRLLQKTYKYFEDFYDVKTGLVYDNYQERHDIGAAMRTSPTNIGFSIIAHSIAFRFKIITADIFIEKIRTLINTIMNMEKWHGNLFNWYATSDAKPLFPKYVSLVDSGNLKACLLYLSDIIERSEFKDIKKLLSDIRSIIDKMDLTKLYDEKRKQFFIGYNMETDSFGGSHYDLYISESRLTSIIEIGAGRIPTGNWDSLGRNDNCVNEKTVIMSWGGSTFEYFMPMIFLPVYEHSFEEQALDNYLDLQMDYCRRLKIPLGISESCYNDEDMEGNYQYRSFGIPGTGYRRKIETDLVCSPYAALLALERRPEIVMAELQKYTALGASGNYGMYESVDFTPERLDNQKYQVVQNYMAHHQGMIMASIENFLNEGSIRKTFMSIPWIKNNGYSSSGSQS